jgi:hypothetical protein
MKSSSAFLASGSIDAEQTHELRIDLHGVAVHDLGSVASHRTTVLSSVCADAGRARTTASKVSRHIAHLGLATSWPLPGRRASIVRPSI